MALKFVPTKGIELSLSEYTKLRAFQGGGWFWDHESQQVIRDCLGEFLPRVEEHSDPNGALFQHFAGGSEVASKSRAVGQQMDRVPKNQLDRLQRAVETLKRKTQDTQTDPNARQIIERFRLPDPAKDPELYRLYGSPWNRKLLVLWGCERESGTSLTPFSALSKMPVEPIMATWLRRLPLVGGLLLLLLLLAALIITLLPQHHDMDPVPVPPDSMARNNETPPAIGSAGAPLQNSEPGSSAAPFTPASGSTDTSVTPTSIVTANPASSIAPAPGMDTNARSAPGNDGLPGASQSPASSSMVRPMAGKNEPMVNNTPGKPFVDQPATIVPPSPRLSASDSPAPGSVPQKPGVSSPIRDHSPPKVENPEESTAAGNPPPSAPDTSPGSQGLAPRQTGTDRPVTSSTPDHSSPPATASATPRLEIINAKNSTSPKDGKVNTLLVLSAHGIDGMSQPVKIIRWSIDGVPQVDAAKKLITANELSANLTPGKHLVNVTGTSASGVPLESESEMDVQIRTQGDAKLKPTGKK